MQVENGDSRKTLSEINITPMVDVMLVLLIIFMVTAPMLKQGVMVELPKTSAKVIDTESKISILTIKKNKKIFLGKIEIPYKILQKKIGSNLKLQQEKELYLHADHSLSYGYIVQIMALIKNAGIEKLSMITDPFEK